MAKRNWLITGVAGFVGSNVALHYLRQGDTVIGIDNFYSGTQENLNNLLGFDHFHFYEMDIRSSDIETLLNQYEITHVLHLAAVVSVPVCERDPELAMDVNVDGLNNLLSMIKKYPVKQFMYASSSAVYGSAQQLPIREDALLKPISIYGKTKVQNENDVKRFSDETNIPCIGFRFFNLFGGNPAVKNAYAAVIPLWANAIKQEIPVTIYGDGTATRDFCYIDNVMHAIDRVVATELKDHHVFNIGTGKPTPLNQLFELLCQIYQKHPKPIYQPWRETDILHSCADIGLAEKILGYHPHEDIKESLKKWLV